MCSMPSLGMCSWPVANWCGNSWRTKAMGMNVGYFGLGWSPAETEADFNPTKEYYE